MHASSGPSAATPAEPGTTEPGTTEPGTTEPGTTEPDPAGPPPGGAVLDDGVVRLVPTDSAARWFSVCLVDQDGSTVFGTASIDEIGDGIGELRCVIEASHRGHGYAVRAVRLLVRHGFDTLRLTRLQAHAAVEDGAALRVASRAGLRREGVLRGLAGTAARHGHADDFGNVVVLARLANDPEPETWPGFVGLANAALPRKRVIAHVVVRDEADRVLLCETTYKADWELPGGVVEAGESPATGAAREVVEELGVDLPVGALLDLTWLPPWNGWDDALALLYDGGRHDGRAFLARCALQPREILDARFCSPDKVREHTTAATYERVLRAIAAAE